MSCGYGKVERREREGATSGDATFYRQEDNENKFTMKAGGVSNLSLCVALAGC